MFEQRRPVRQARIRRVNVEENQEIGEEIERILINDAGENVELNNLRRRMDRRARRPLNVSTIGMEIELLHTTINEANDLILSSKHGNTLSNMYTITRDASAELYCQELPTKSGNILRVNLGNNFAKNLLGNVRRSTSGFEIVSKPLQRPDMKFFINTVFDLLNKKGAFTSPRCATHVHVGISNDLRVLKSSLAFALHYEDLFFMLAGMGTEYRGKINNSAYARPLSSGIWLPARNSTWVKIPNWEYALNASDVYEYYYAFHVDAGESLPKHHPCRYTSINLYSILEKGTLEFRGANSTLNPVHANAYVSLCQGATELVSYYDYRDLQKLGVCDVYANNGKGFFHNKLDHLASLINSENWNYKMMQEEVDTLHEIIEITPKFNIGENTPILTHTRDFIASPELIRLGNLEKTKTKPMHPGNIDIHNILNTDVSIL